MQWNHQERWTVEGGWEINRSILQATLTVCFELQARKSNNKMLQRRKHTHTEDKEVSADITRPTWQLHNFQPYEYCGSEVFHLMHNHIPTIKCNSTTSFACCTHVEMVIQSNPCKSRAFYCMQLYGIQSFLCVCVCERERERERCERLLLGAMYELPDGAKFVGKWNVLLTGGSHLEALKLVGRTGGALQVPETSVSTERHSCRRGNSTLHATVRRIFAW